MTNRDIIEAKRKKTVRIVRTASGGARVMLLRSTTMPIHLCDASRVEREGNYIRAYIDGEQIATWHIRREKTIDD